MAESFVAQTVIFLASAVIAVPLMSRLGLGSVLGYLLAGVIIGPSVIGLVKNVDAIMHFSELGVVLLLFLIGLELNPRRLWSMRRQVLGTGAVQVIATTLILAGSGLFFGLPMTTSLVLAMGLSLSSTAISLQILRERNSLTTPAGSQAFSTLLFQDLAVIPMLAIIPMLAGAGQAGEGSLWVSVFRPLAAILGVFIVGRYVTRPIFRIIAAERLREVFTAFALLIVLGVGLLMNMAQMSMALGTFLAGVILADSEYRHELEIDIEPFKGLLLGLFFMSVGMSIDLGVFKSEPVLIPMLVVALVSIKAIVLLLIGRLVKLPRSQLGTFAFVMSQAGEFAFVLFGVAKEASILDRDVSDVAVAVVALSMLTTPFLMILNDKLSARRQEAPRDPDDIQSIDGAVIIAGFGRFGQIVGRLLHAHGIGTTILDHDPSQIELTRKFGYKVFYGDATRLDLLEAAGIKTARLMIVAIDDPQTSLEVVRTVRSHFPDLKVLARARNRNHAFDLIDQGIAFPVRETFDASLTLGAEALKALGYSSYRARRATLRFRDHDMETLRTAASLRENAKALVSATVAAREEFAKLLARDAKEEDISRDDEWTTGPSDQGVRLPP